MLNVDMPVPGNQRRLTIDALGERQLDAMREIGTIGSGAAATALSSLLKRRIMIRVPDLSILPRSDAADHLFQDQDAAVIVAMEVVGDVNGQTLFVLPLTTANCLLARLVQREVRDIPGGLDELTRSTLLEVGNILAGAYLNTLSDFLGLTMLMSVPEFRFPRRTALDPAREARASNLVLQVQTIFEIDGERAPLHGSMVINPTAASLRVILSALRVA